MSGDLDVWMEKLTAAWSRWVHDDVGQTVASEDAPSAVRYLAGELAADPDLAIVGPLPPPGQAEVDWPDYWPTRERIEQVMAENTAWRPTMPDAVQW